MALTRGLHMAATVSLLGTTGFIAWMLPAAPAVPARLQRRLTRLWWSSGLIALLAGFVWFAIQTARMADAHTVPDWLNALPLVAGHTRYGTIMMVRLGLLAAATLAPLIAGGTNRVLLYPTIAVTGAALGLQGMIGHAGATEGAIGDGLVLSEFLHLLAAGFWLGALLPLAISLRVLAPTQAAAVCERFSPIGLACVLVLAGTGCAQGLALIGSLPALLGTAYGHIALLKIALFLLALGLAALNRLWLTDRLAVGGAKADRQLLMSVCVEICVGLAIVGAAAFMASSVPAEHDTPVWPFSWQFSLTTVNEDPDFRQEVTISLIAIGIAVAATVASLLARRFRLIALAILTAILLFRAPSLALLTIDAYPTSFQTSPTGFAAASIARGQTLFARDCSICHGANADGHGPASATLRIKPADLTQPHIWGHTDGEMFWWLTHGIDDPEGRPAMPGFATTLSADDRWALIDYIRAHNAGLAMQRDAVFDVPVRAPAMPLTCAGITASRMADLRGHAVHLVTSDTDNIDIPPESGITTVRLDLRDGATPTQGGCATADPAAGKAYAILANLPQGNLAGTAFLIDPNGWLRAVHRPDAPGGWHTKDDMIAVIHSICTNPIAQPSGGEHEHHH